MSNGDTLLPFDGVADDAAANCAAEFPTPKLASVIGIQWVQVSGHAAEEHQPTRVGVTAARIGAGDSNFQRIFPESASIAVSQPCLGP